MTNLRKKLFAAGAVTGLMFAGATPAFAAEEEVELEITVTVAVDIDADGIPDVPDPALP